MPARLSGKVAVITGAAGGFGRVLVQALLAEGAAVAALDVDEPRLAGLQATVAPESLGRLLIMTCDIADYAACARTTAATMAQLGGLHILINNGALGMLAVRRDHFQNPVGIREIDPALWQRFVAVNFTGAWNMTRACIEPMLAQRWGRIIDVTTSFFTMLRGGFH